MQVETFDEVFVNYEPVFTCVDSENVLHTSKVWSRVALEPTHIYTTYQITFYRLQLDQ